MLLVIQNKYNGVYQVRLVGKGFSQTPGLDFMDNFSPDVTFQVVITQMIIQKWDAEIVDIDNAFLNGELEHEIYMAIPEGYTECIKQCEENKTLKLEKAIYGLVQAARPFFKKIHNLLLQANFKAREADPCLVYKEDKETGVCIIFIYIDDMLIVGKTEAIEEIRVLQ